MMTQTCPFPQEVEGIEGIHEMPLSETSTDARNNNIFESTSSLQTSQLSNNCRASHPQETTPLHRHVYAAPTKPIEHVLTADVEEEISEDHEPTDSKNNFHFGMHKDDSVHQEIVTSSLVSELSSTAELFRGIKPDIVKREFVIANASKKNIKQDDTKLGNTYRTDDSLDGTIASQNASLWLLLNCDHGKQGSDLSGADNSMGRKPYICELSGNSYQDLCGLQSHVTHNHTDLKPFTCLVCNKSFAISKNLKSHMIEHSEARNYSCIVCSKNFKYKHELRIHMFVHTGDDAATCKVCDKIFTTPSTLKSHMVTHSGEKLHRCEHCDESFSLPDKLKAHVNCDHSWTNNLSCVFCNKKLVGKESLKMHLRLHTGEKPHVCKICDHAFRTSYHLKAHARTCLPYYCIYCKKRFATSNEILMHMVFHTGKKPH